MVAGDAESTAGEFGDFSDDDPGSFAGVDNDWEEDSTGDDQLGCRLPTALFSSKPTEDLDHIRGTGQLWDPNQGDCNAQDVVAAGQMASIVAMIIMTVMY